MNTSIFLARLIGPIALVVGVALFMHADASKAMAQDFLHSTPLIFISGVAAMALGLAIVLSHNVWVADWRVLITIFGWFAAIGGAIRVLLPDTVRSIGQDMIESKVAMMVGGGIWLALGVIFCLFGYLR
jgi:uncharacterized membrane protein